MQAIERRNATNRSVKKPSTRVAARKSGGKLKLVTLDALDGRTFAVKKAKKLVADISADLGGDDQLTAGARELVQHAAILGSMIESAETEWLSGKPVDIPNLLSSINAQRRTLLALGIERRVARDITPTLADIAREIDAERDIDRDDVE
jgi:hypothetical protein